MNFRLGDIVKLTGRVVACASPDRVTVEIDGTFSHIVRVDMQPDRIAVKIPALQVGDRVTWGEDAENIGTVRGLSSDHAWIEREGSGGPRFISRHIAGVERL